MTHRFRIIACALLGAVVLHADRAAATPIIDYAEQQIAVDGHVTTLFGAGPFTASDTVTTVSPAGIVMESASQDTLIAALSAGGSGNAETSLTGPGMTSRHALAQLMYNFTLDANYFADLTGGLASTGYGHAEAFLVQDAASDHPIYLAFENADNSVAAVDFHGTLVPGFYTFYLLAQSQTSPLEVEGSGTASFDVALNLTPEIAPQAVPEPSAMLLMTTGLIGLYRNRRDQQSRREPRRRD